MLVDNLFQSLRVITEKALPTRRKKLEQRERREEYEKRRRFGRKGYQNNFAKNNAVKIPPLPLDAHVCHFISIYNDTIL